ncbi:nickel/cobalt efflux transporter [Microvirga terricola]|uniref:Nickel/cobalt efflux system n=1 Tax=Microvirga terricola TaxID=2719797 RepID=A0ABX0VH19_9HYPH|nr:nickel/cobalt efflux transporter [Microvirga terricola]NIX78135.1 nickel/cobalt efflux transporter RcnA [Microvirga terricola]
MPSFADLIQQSAAHAWLFVPSAIALGALHGLEPGHSKTLMAAFIIAVRGTVWQAILLGLAATISHTVVVWGIALTGMYLWRDVNAETTEPYFQLASGGIIIAVAAWMIWRTWRDRRFADAMDGHHHHHHHDHDHHHHDDVRHIDTGHGVLALEIAEDAEKPRWRIRALSGHAWAAGNVALETERPDGTVQAFSFVQKNGCLESAEEIPEPHEFMARLKLSHGDHAHRYDVSFVEGHGHDPLHEEVEGLQLATDGYQDAHELAHANDIRRRFAGRSVTTWQIVLFGLTGGLIPCPAAITVLLICLQLKQIPLGVVLVLCFSIGLAITLVSVGAAAALSVRYASQRTSWFNAAAQRAPYLSGGLIALVGLYVGLHGWWGVQALSS